MNENEFGLNNNEREMIRAVLTGYPFVLRAVIFGSRAKGTHTSRSDIDMALFGNVLPMQAEEITMEMEELPMPYRFDIQTYNAIKNVLLKEHIDRVGKTVYEKCEMQISPPNQ
jgi:predicted nucleotidyltransferase